MQIAIITGSRADYGLLQPLAKLMNKDKNIDVLKKDEYFKLFKKQLLSEDRYKLLTAKEIDINREKCLNWLAAKGKQQKDYRAFFRNWIMKLVENKGGSSGTGMVF